MRIAVAALLLCVALPSWAQGSATLSWTLPTELADGRLISETGGLSGVGIYVDGERVATAAGVTTSYVVEDLGYGSHEFYVTAIRTVDGVPIESAMSNTDIKVIPDRVPPKAPTLIEVILAFLAGIVRAIGSWLV